MLKKFKKILHFFEVDKYIFEMTIEEDPLALNEWLFRNSFFMI